MSSLADALPAEIARVSAKRDRWRDLLAQDPDLWRGLVLGIALMEATIAEGVGSLASGDVIRMLRAFEALKGYDDED